MKFPPISYHLRSLFVRKRSTLLTTLSIGATVAVLAGVLALQQGFTEMFQERGRDDLVVFLRPGATSEGESAFPPDRAKILQKETVEIASAEDGSPLASGELYLAVRRDKIDGGETNVPIRGVEMKSFEIHKDSLAITDGRRFAEGTDEVIVGIGIVDRFQNCQVGQVLQINTTPFRVVGTFRGKGGQNSEIWGDARRLMAALERQNFSRVIAVVNPEDDLDSLKTRLESDKRVPAKVLTEKEYLSSQTNALSTLFLFIGTFLAIVMGVAAIFTGTNAMFSQISARTQEIGILQSIGFRPLTIFVGFMIEAALLGLLGGILGVLLVLPLHGIQTGTMNNQTFSEVVFSFRTLDTTVIGTAILVAVILGIFGGAVPAIQAATMQPTTALRRR